MTIKLNREHNLKVNHKRIYRLMKILNLKSICRRKRKNYIKSTPEITAKNVLNREFNTVEFGKKWLTDVTEMKYGSGNKEYLSAILDLGDKSIVSFVMGKFNKNLFVPGTKLLSYDLSYFIVLFIFSCIIHMKFNLIFFVKLIRTRYQVIELFNSLIYEADQINTFYRITIFLLFHLFYIGYNSDEN